MAGRWWRAGGGLVGRSEVTCGGPLPNFFLPNPGEKYVFEEISPSPFDLRRNFFKINLKKFPTGAKLFGSKKIKKNRKKGEKIESQEVYRVNSNRKSRSLPGKLK